MEKWKERQKTVPKTIDITSEKEQETYEDVDPLPENELDEDSERRREHIRQTVFVAGLCFVGIFYPSIVSSDVLWNILGKLIFRFRPSTSHSFCG